MDISHIDIEISLRTDDDTPNKTVFSRKFRIDADFGFGLREDSFRQFIHHIVDRILLELEKFMEAN